MSRGRDIAVDIYKYLRKRNAKRFENYADSEDVVQEQAVKLLQVADKRLDETRSIQEQNYYMWRATRLRRQALRRWGQYGDFRAEKASLSLDAELTDDVTLYDFVAAPADNNDAADFERLLTSNACAVCCDMVRLNIAEGFTLVEIGAVYGVSKQRIDQRIKTVLARIEIDLTGSTKKKMFACRACTALDRLSDNI